jgi:succinate dehydrogenase hydrophobic anchor subunit
LSVDWLLQRVTAILFTPMLRDLQRQPVSILFVLINVASFSKRVHMR